MMMAPFALDNFAVTDNLEGKGAPVVNVTAGEHDLPKAAIGKLHGNVALADAKLHAFAPRGMVLKLDVDGHRVLMLLAVAIPVGIGSKSRDSGVVLQPTCLSFLPNRGNTATNER